MRRARLAVVLCWILRSSSSYADEPAATVNGLYPLWEQTGSLHPAGTVEVGYAHAQVGLGPVQVGTQPFLDLYGTANADAKVALWRGSRAQWALTAAVYRLPAAAGERSLGNLYATGFVNPYAPVWLAPVSVASTFMLWPRLRLHTNTTVLISQSADAAQRFVALGKSAMLEALAGPRWSARLHGGIEGWPVDPRGHVGLSFGYRSEHLLLALGAARRIAGTDESANIIMFDAGVLLR